MSHLRGGQLLTFSLQNKVVVVKHKDQKVLLWLQCHMPTQTHRTGRGEYM